jgi:hypothetical protein
LRQAIGSEHQSLALKLVRKLPWASQPFLNAAPLQRWLTKLLGLGEPMCCCSGAW